MDESIEYALQCIVWYDGHDEWLEELAEQLENTPKEKNYMLEVEWHSEKHTIWMLLVGMFGSWGTSIRGGWIEQKEECAKYIRQLCKNARGEYDEQN